MIEIINAFPEAPEIIKRPEALRAPECLESSVAHGTRDPLGKKNRYILFFLGPRIPNGLP